MLTSATVYAATSSASCVPRNRAIKTKPADRGRRVQSNLPVVITSGFKVEDALKQPYVVGFLEKAHTMTSLEMLLASVTQHTPQLAAAAAETAGTATHDARANRCRDSG